MNERYLYLALDLGSLLFPLVFSFYTKAKFYKEWRHVLPAIVIVAAVFILWDEWFTQLGIWGFNTRYLTGMYVGSLPIEELLFFFCIPYACMFVYFTLNHLFEKDYLAYSEKYVTGVLLIFLVASGIVYIDRWYTSITFLCLAIFLFLLKWLGKPTYLSRFYLSYLFILVPFFLINGVLTGSWIEEEIVWYANTENSGIRIGTVPFDDLFYNMLMLLLITSLYEWFKGRK